MARQHRYVLLPLPSPVLTPLDLHNFSASDPVIGYFWRAVRSFTHEERAKLLQFVSGSSRVPLEGFSSLQGMSGITKFSITSAGTSQGLPTARTFPLPSV